MLVSEQLGVNKQGTPWVFHVLARGSDSKKSVGSNELRRVVVKVFVELGICGILPATRIKISRQLLRTTKPKKHQQRAKDQPSIGWFHPNFWCQLSSLVS
jgi:hypothetical protein